MKKKKEIYFRLKYVLIILTVLFLGILVLTYARGETIASYKNKLAGLLSPVRNTVSFLREKVGGSSRDRREKEELAAQVEKLTKEKEELKEQLLHYSEDLSELSELRRLYELEQKYYEYEMTGAKVIAKDAGNWFHRFSIDKGTDDGLALDMNVLGVGGLAGIITDIGPNYAVVTSVIDDDMHVSAINRTTRDQCMVNGSLKDMKDGLITISHIDGKAVFRDYDAIVTSSISSKYLPGILVGYAWHITADGSQLTQSGYLIPAVDFEHLDTVLIVTGKKIRSGSAT